LFLYTFEDTVHVGDMMTRKLRLLSQPLAVPGNFVTLTKSCPWKPPDAPRV